MAQSLQFFRRIMLLLNVTVGAFLVWVFGMTPVLAARQADGVAFAQNLSALPAKPWTLAIAVLGMAALILAGDRAVPADRTGCIAGGAACGALLGISAVF